MKIIYSLEELPDIKEAYVTIGNFDGIHLGHKKIIENLCSEAIGKPKIAITFEKAPIEFLSPENFLGYLFPSGCKDRHFEAFGIDYTVSLNFEKISSISAEDFIRGLLNKIKKLTLYVGYNFKFGKGNSGNVELLEKESINYHFNLKVIGKVLCHNTAVSSSSIRSLIADGKMEKASDMLGRPYFIKSTAEKGDGLGSKIGYPTINLKINGQVLPKKGIYFTLIQINNNLYPAMTYIGSRPTLNGLETRNETNILQLNEEFQSKTHTIFFISRIRDEKKFHNLDELQKNLYNDKKVVLSLYSEKSFSEKIRFLSNIIMEEVRLCP